MAATKKKPGGFTLERLATAISKARLSLRSYRELRVRNVRQYAGSGWGENGAEQPVPVNLLALYTQIVGRSLIPKSPQFMLSTFDKSQKPTISKMETWLNEEVERMRLQVTLRRILLDSLFAIGISKVALASPADSMIAGWQTAAGNPFCERVDLDDFVYDVHARSFEEVGFIGHRYRAPLHVIREDRKTYSSARLELEPSEHKMYNQQGDERIDVMGRGFYSSEEDYDDFVDLWEIYVPRLQAVFTLQSDFESGGIDTNLKPLRVQKWMGPETGPYSILSFADVPGNAFPKAPIMDLAPLHIAMNQLWRKLLRQAERQKETWAVRAVGNQASKDFAQANDGEFWQCDDPNSIHAVVSQGPSPGNFQFAGAVRDMFSWIGGNLEAMGGLSPQAKTLGQDQMLAQNSSKLIADMQDTTISFTQTVGKNLLWFWHHHPTKVMRSVYSPPNLPEYSITREATPQDRQQIAWNDLNLQVNPYSQQHSTPQTRMQALDQLVTTVIIPLAPVLQQQGITFDLNAYLQKKAKLMDMPDLQDIVTYSATPSPDESEQSGGEQLAGKPPETKRTYERVSRGGDTTNNRDAGRMNAAASGWKQAGGQANGMQNKAG